jgi:hemin uptake protein HemP
MNSSKSKSPEPASITKNIVPTSSFAPGLPCVSSSDLIGEDREIMIEHSGVYYRLRVTRANKLILTK